MRHFEGLDPASVGRLFEHPPVEFARDADRDTLATALGATLYMPATRPGLATDLLRAARNGSTSAVLCLEDAIADRDLVSASANLVDQLRNVVAAEGEPPLVFVRVRYPEQVPAIVGALGDDAAVLSGFVFPKFNDVVGAAFLDALDDTASSSGLRLLGMPVLETAEIVHRETRADVLVGIARLLGKHRDSVLAVRIGATDMCGTLGIRRGRDLTVYDVHPVASVISDIVNVFGRTDGTGFTVTGPVWEYFGHHDRLFKPQLRWTPFAAHDATALRMELLTADIDGLIRELVLDRANGLLGKTVIHPSHVAAVHALSVVTHEEHSDALDVLAVHAAGGGVSASRYANKMNEAGPHLTWAQRTVLRAAVFGVAAEGVNFIDLLAAGSQ
ncbi:MAG: HpcH/HpaI aldolase/citrate lyase family protein [Sporichthyaceae bacterium]